MIRVDLDEATLLGLRMATSPLWETVASLALLARYRSEVPFPYSNWARVARRALSTSLGGALPELMRGLRLMQVPSFLTPVPPAPWPTIEEELAILVGTPDDVVSAGIAELYPAGVPEPYARFVTEPSRALARFAELIDAYWQQALAQYWSLMRNALEEEILFRGRTLATEGSEGLLRSLSGRVRWERPWLTVPHQTDFECRLRNTQVLLVPVLFARGLRTFCRGRDGVAALSYQARGSVALDQRPVHHTAIDMTPTAEDRLALLLGRGRAAVMRALTAPTTTTAVASAVGLAPSTVSEHLTALSATGMVRRHRAGARVFYELDRGGVALLSHVDGAPG